MDVRELLDMVRSTLFQLNLMAYEDLLASLENSEEKGCHRRNGSTKLWAHRAKKHEKTAFQQWVSEWPD
jgi:hypothetical protein